MKNQAFGYPISQVNSIPASGNNFREIQILMQWFTFNSQSINRYHETYLRYGKQLR